MLPEPRANTPAALDPWRFDASSCAGSAVSHQRDHDRVVIIEFLSNHYTRKDRFTQARHNPSLVVIDALAIKAITAQLRTYRNRHLHVHGRRRKQGYTSAAYCIGQWLLPFYGRVQ